VREKAVEELEEDLGEKPRVAMPKVPPEKRIRRFVEIEEGFSEDKARVEA
jgi:hypothetical protein